MRCVTRFNGAASSANKAHKSGTAPVLAGSCGDIANDVRARLHAHPFPHSHFRPYHLYYHSSLPPSRLRAHVSLLWPSLLAISTYSLKLSPRLHIRHKTFVTSDDC